MNPLFKKLCVVGCKFYVRIQVTLDQHEPKLTFDVDIQYEIQSKAIQ